MPADTLPKNLRKSRFEEIHPLLRRSICTLMIAFITVATGFLIILVDMLVYDKKVSVAGFILSIIGILLVIIGFVWFRHSKRKLEIAREKLNQARMKKIQGRRISKPQIFNQMQMLLMTSKHTVPWPTRANCSIDDCKTFFTSPNGNHLCSHQTSDSEDDSPSSANLKLLRSMHPVSASSSNLEIHESTIDSCKAQEATTKVKEYPIRINKSGDVIPTTSAEKCPSRAVFTFDDVDEISSKSFRTKSLSNYAS